MAQINFTKIKLKQEYYDASIKIQSLQKMKIDRNKYLDKLKKIYYIQSSLKQKL